MTKRWLKATLAALLCHLAVTAHATVSSSGSTVQAAGNGTTTQFTFPYPYLAATDLVVTLFNTASNANVSPAPVLNGAGTYDYTVTGISPVSSGNNVTEYGSATITFNTAPPGGDVALIQRIEPATQLLNEIDNAKNPSASRNAEFDKLTMLLQQVQAQTSLAIQAPATDAGGLSYTLPPAGARANQYAGFDASGNATTFTGTASAPVSTPMAPVVDSASLLAAAKAMGLPFVTPEMFGAYGDGQQRADCAVAGSPAVVTCTGYSFVAADQGKVAAFLAAGAAVTGGQTASLRGSIASVNAGAATLSVNTGTAVASGGTFAWGHDDTSAIAAAIAAGSTLTAQQAAPAQTVKLCGAGYVITGTLAVGGAAGIPALEGCQRTPVYCLPPAGATILADADCVTLAGAGTSGDGGGEEDMKPTRLEKLVIDGMNLGRTCVVQQGATDPVIRDVVIQNCAMDGLALKITTNFTDVKQALIENVSIGNVGLHCLYLYAAGSHLFINDNTAINLHCGSVSLNGAAILAAAGGPAAPWSSWSGGNKTTYNPQLGAALYVMDQATGDSGFYRFSCLNCIFIANATLAQASGSNINPNVAVFADGTAAHAVEGAGVAGTGLGTNSYTQFHFLNGESENISGTAPSGGYQFYAETPEMMSLFADLLMGGAGNWSGFGDNFDTTASGDLALVPNIGGYPIGIWGGDWMTQASGASALATSSVSGFLRAPTENGRMAPTGNTYNLTNFQGGAAITVDQTDHKICWYEPATSAVYCASGS
jgi:hypothetical protein